MATRGRIVINGADATGLFGVRGVDTASTQLLAEADHLGAELEIRAVWPRVAGGRAVRKLRLATSPRSTPRSVQIPPGALKIRKD